MWSRGHVLGGRVTAATRLCFPYFAMRWGFARPRVRGDRRDLTTGMSGGADVGLPRLGLSGNGNTGWGRHICWLYPLCDVETPPARRQGQATVLLDAESGMRLGRVPLPQCASLCRSASRIASRFRQPSPPAGAVPCQLQGCPVMLSVRSLVNRQPRAWPDSEPAECCAAWQRRPARLRSLLHVPPTCIGKGAMFGPRDGRDVASRSRSLAFGPGQDEQRLSSCFNSRRPLPPSHCSSEVQFDTLSCTTRPSHGGHDLELSEHAPRPSWIL